MKNILSKILSLIVLVFPLTFFSNHSSAQTSLKLEDGTLSCVTSKGDEWIVVEDYPKNTQVILSRSTWAGVMKPALVKTANSLAESQSFFGSTSPAYSFPFKTYRLVGFQMIPGFTGELVQTDVKFDFVWGAQSKKSGLFEARLFVSRKLSATESRLEDTITFNDCAVIAR